MRPIRLTIFPDLTAPGDLDVEELASFDELFSALQEEYKEYDDKNAAPLLSPVAEWSKEYRSNANVRRMGRVAVLDFDTGTLEPLAAAEGYSHIVYTTHSHTPEVPKYRILLELEDEYPVALHATLWSALRAHFGGSNDKSAKDPSRAYFLPSAKPGRINQGFVTRQHGRLWALPRAPLPGQGPLVTEGAAPPGEPVPRPQIDVTLQSWARQGKNLEKKATAQAAKALMQGKNIIPVGAGQRNTFLASLAGFLAQQFPRGVELSKHFAGIGWDLFNEDGKYPLSHLDEMVARFQTKQAAESATRAVEHAAKQTEEIKAISLGERDGPCSEEEWDLLQAAFAGRTQRHLILQYGRLHFFLDPGGFYLPRGYRTEEFHLAMRDHLSLYPPPIVEWYTDDEQKKSERQMLQDYCTVVNEMVYDLTIEHSLYDAGRLRVACGAPVVRPVFHEDIQYFLQEAGGELLLDVCAGLQRLDEMMPIIVFTGEGRVGKSLILKGHTMVRGTPGLKLEAVVGDTGRFNFALKDNPFIVQDESAGAVYAKFGSSLLREGTTQGERYIEPKGIEKVKLIGFIRYLFAANNDNILDTSEGMGAADREAYAERILHVPFPPSMRGLCDSIKPIIENEWVREKRLPEHLLWLAKNHQIKHRGQRFLVTGERTQLHEGLAGGGGGSADLLYWLLCFCANPAAIVTQGAPIELKDGHLRVNSRAPMKHWEAYLKGDRVPKPHELARALQSVSGNKMQKIIVVEAGRQRRRDAYEVNIDELRSANRRFRVLTDEEFDELFPGGKA